MSSTGIHWNTRFQAFCRARGLVPHVVAGAQPWTGEYISWIRERWAEWDRAERPDWARVLGEVRKPEEHALFNMWLERTTP